MLANSISLNKNLSDRFLLAINNQLNNTYMKLFRHVFIFILLLTGTSQLFAQGTIAQPDTICDGDQVTLTLKSSVINTSKTVAYYKFYYDNTHVNTMQGLDRSNPSYIFFTCPPGNWKGSAKVVYTDSTSDDGGTVDFTVSYRPIANFLLDPGSNDSVCFNGGHNSVCFINKSLQNPQTPSNPLVSCLWVWGDGNKDNICSPALVCHSYAFLSALPFDVTLKITDSKGCTNAITNPQDSTGGQSGLPTGIHIVGISKPDFKWKQISGPCFKSCYRFTNLSAVALQKIQYYQWDFGDKNLCESYFEPDSNQYTAFAPFLPHVALCDSVIHKFDSLQYDTIVHCYCDSGIFKPSLKIIDLLGCADSLRKTPQNAGGALLPQNIKFYFDITSAKTDLQGSKGHVLADSVCSGSGNGATICFNQTPVSFASTGTGDFVWNFGDPNDPNNKNLDSMTWNPCHKYSGMGSFFPALKIKNICPDTTFNYYAARVVGPYRRYLDTLPDDQRDLIDGLISNSSPQFISTGWLPKNAIGFDGQVLVLNNLDSVQLSFVGLVGNFAKYKMIGRNKYYGDSAYYFNTLPFTSPYSSDLIPPDSIPVYNYSIAGATPPILNIKSTQLPVSWETGKVGTVPVACASIIGSSAKHKYYFNSILDTNGNIAPKIWYKFSRSYNYGVRILGPSASIESGTWVPAGAPPVNIDAKLKNQCGPRDTVDFVNATNYEINNPVAPNNYRGGYKARNVWRRWDFGDIYAPQCTSFTKPHVGWPAIHNINTYSYYVQKDNKNDYLSIRDSLVTVTDTVRMWNDALEQYMNSDHFFISNGQTYPGRRNCNFSHDTLPRHHYPNWDSVYLWYRYGHDFMPWDTVRFTNDPTKAPTSTLYRVKAWDSTWWGKKVYLNINTGEWSLKQDSAKMYNYISGTYPKYNPCTGKTTIGYNFATSTTGIWVKWPRIDTMATGAQPQDLWPGNSRTNGIVATLLPDPFQMVLGGYYLISGVTIDTVTHHPSLFYTDQGKTILLPSGTTILPGSNEDLFEYTFRRIIQKCLTVKLLLTDSLNNESSDPGSGSNAACPDLSQLDIWDCTSEAQVQLVLGKPDARGMGKKGKECPGKDKPGSPALVFNNANGYPGVQLNCGRTSIWIDIDSLADRMDNTPCYLDGFTSWGIGTVGTQLAPGPGTNTTPGGLTRNTFYTLLNWNPNPPSPWTGPGSNVLQYHMGGNAGTPPAADALQGFVTVGIYLGNGQADSTINVWESNYKTNTTNAGGPLRDWLGRFYFFDAASQQNIPYTYQTLPLVDSVVNQMTPPPVPIPNGWVDDSIVFNYAFNKIIAKKPMIRYPAVGTTPAIWDTMYSIEYLDPNWPNCMSDTVWYHNFWHIKDLDPTFAKSPAELATLRERYDTMWVVYRDSIQDSVKTTVWSWGDNTATIDSFYYAGIDTTNDFFVHGVRRVRYNMDYTNGLPGVLMDSTLWPCGVYGTRQFKEPMRYYKRYYDSIGFIAPDVLMLLNKCPIPGGHDGNGHYQDSIGLPTIFTIRQKDTILLPKGYLNYFDIIQIIAPDSIVLKSRDANVNLPTINISKNDTSRLPQPYHNIINIIGSILPDTIIYTITHLDTHAPVNVHISRSDFNTLPSNRNRLLSPIGFIGTDTIVFKSVCPNPSHYDSKWFPYSNYFDTLFLRLRDTLIYTQYRTIDTALMMLPVSHQYFKTSWEMNPSGKVAGATITQMNSFIENTQKCQYSTGNVITVGVIDTLHIYGGDWVEDTIFCKSETVHFVDSVRYFRYDDQITDVPNLNFGRSRTVITYIDTLGIPYRSWQFDSTDFWARDANNPSDTLVNPGFTTGFLLDFKYFEGKWTNWDLNQATATITHLSGPYGHWDVVLRGGSVPVVAPTGVSDSAGLGSNVYPGKIIYYPAGLGGLGTDGGLYVWDFFGGWIPAYAPVTIDSLKTISDSAGLVNPTSGRTLIYNNGKGAVKRQGMYYWSGGQWVFICNSPYTSFPYFTHKLYWDFGDGSPIYVGIRPSHKYEIPGRFKVTMVSRDSIGAFDTCIAHVEVMKPVAVPHVLFPVIGCKDTASFADSSFVLTGVGANNTMDKVDSVFWWFTIKYSYPNGLQGADTMQYRSILHNPTWYYSKKGVYKVKLAIVTVQGCRDTATDSIVVQGPRPAFKLITDTIGCKPFRVGIWNMADSFDMRSLSDTPTLSTIIYWTESSTQTIISGRRDTVWHVYPDTGYFAIYAAGRDADQFHTPTCPITYTPDSSEGGGFERLIYITVKEPYRAKITSVDTVCVNQSFTVKNTSDSLSYSGYRFERRKFDTNLSFIDGIQKFGTAPLITKFDTIGRYKIILFPDSFQSTVPYQARCATQDTITVTALKPKAIFDTLGSSAPSFVFNNHSIAADYYNWVIFEKDGITPRSDGKATVYPPNIDWKYNLGLDTGTYKVCLTAFKIIPPNPSTDESCPDSVCKIINYTYETHIIIPNVFTPDGDGHNDFYKIDILGELKYDLTIFNRWGTKVFASDNKDNMWNGKNYNDGSDCSSGTYFFAFTYKLKGSNEDKTVHGTITLIKPN